MVIAATECVRVGPSVRGFYDRCALFEIVLIERIEERVPFGGGFMVPFFIDFIENKNVGIGVQSNGQIHACQK